MAITRREERGLLSSAEFELIGPSHHPQVAALDGEALRALATRLREGHGQARDLLRAGRRARSGKGEARAASSVSHEKLSRKKQVFAAALKRVNARFEELAGERQRREHRAALRAALERRRATRPSHPASGWTAGSGMRAKGSARRDRTINSGRIGSVSQANKAAQARRDA